MSNPQVNAAKLSSEERSSLERWLLQRMQQGQPNANPVQKPNLKCMPVSLGQESLWFFDRLEPNSALYTIPEALRLSGPLNVDALATALNTVFARHSALRTKFVAVDGKPMQLVDSEASFSFPVWDLSDLSNKEAELSRRIHEEATKPFDLSHAPMWRVQLLKFSSVEHVLLLTLHHIVSDHSSILLLHQEIEQLYAASISRQVAPLPPLPVQFPELSAMQRQHSARYSEHLEFWKRELDGDLPVLDLPTDYPRPKIQTFRGARKKIQFPPSLLHDLKNFSRAQNTTLYVTLLAAFQVLLHRYTNQEDLVVGAPVSSRTQSNAEKLIGYFITLLPVRSRVPGNIPFAEFLQATRQTMLNVMAHQEISVEALVEELRISRFPGRNPIFQTVFQFLASPMPGLKLPDIESEVLDVEPGTSKFELTLTLAESPRGLGGDIEYNTDLFSAETVDRLISHFGVLLRSIVACPDAPVASLPMITQQEMERLQKWGNTTTDYPRNATITDLFEARVSEAPDAIAVMAGDQKVSYRELNDRANQLARCLQEHGVRSDVMVAICVERSVEMIVGLLGILKAGGAYVTLDASYPPERLRFMFEDTAAPVFVTAQKFKEVAVPGTVTICLDSDHASLSAYDKSNVKSGASAESIAYVTYTSGSTGKPKGVLVPHRGVVRLVSNTNYLQFSRDDVFLQFAPISFDASTLEIWGPLLNGGRLVMFPPSFDSLRQLASVICTHRITTLWLTSGVFHQMVEEHLEALKGVKYLLAGGDVLSVPHVCRAVRELPNTQLINGYGPTENTTFTCCYAVPPNGVDGSSVPIGRPISNTRVYILDAERQPLPVGIVGELYIGGDGLAREYLNAPELTAEKFVRAPFGLGEKLYRTGDLARWMPDGNIEFIGRKDNQVKVRGFRIELTEVEAALMQHDLVEQAIVIARQLDGGIKQLVGYVVPRIGTTVCLRSLRRFLQEKLPDYMVPSALIKLDSVPLTQNGKVDRRKLPDPGPEEAVSVAAQPRTEVENQIAQIWREVLGVQQVGVHDNFFSLGGHSLLATRIVSRVSSVLGKDVPIRTVFEFPTIESFAEIVGHQHNAKASPGGQLTRRRRPGMTTAATSGGVS